MSNITTEIDAMLVQYPILYEDFLLPLYPNLGAKLPPHLPK